MFTIQKEDGCEAPCKPSSIYFVRLFVCLYVSKTAVLIGPKFFVATNMTPSKRLMDVQNFKKMTVINFDFFKKIYIILRRENSAEQASLMRLKIVRI